MMGMSMGMSQRQCLQQLCTVCDQPIIGPEADQAAARRMLFGVKADTYKVCCKCKQLVGDSTEHDEQYRQRWRNHKDKT